MGQKKFLIDRNFAHWSIYNVGGINFQLSSNIVFVCIHVQEYEASQSCVDRVLQMEPNNMQAKQLKQLVSKKIRRGI